MFHLFYWGGVKNDGLAAKFLETEKQDFWFENLDDRTEFKARLSEFAKKTGQVVCFTLTEADTRTVAVMEFEYKGQKYPFEYDFGVGYPEDSARFMFEEGNYSCDCNRSMFLSREYEAFIELSDSEYKCGDDIEMTLFRCELRPVVKS